MSLADQDLIAEFVVESQEGLALVENQMLTIEAGGADVDVDLVNAVFRTMHSIKGTAGFLGLDRIGTLAHGLEELLNNLRNCELIPTPELVTTMLRSADFMKGLIDAVDSSNEVDVSSHVSELQRFRPGAASSVVAAPLAVAAEVKTASTDATTGQPAANEATAPSVSLSEAVREFLTECHENLDQMERDLVTLESDPTAEAILRNVFRTMHTIKGGAGFLGLGGLEKLSHAAEEVLGNLRSGEYRLNSETANALFASVDKCREGLRLVEASGTDRGFNPQSVINQLLVDPAGDSAMPTESPCALASTEIQAVVHDFGLSQHPTESLAAANVATPGEVSVNDKPAPANADSTIRVDVALLDKLMTRVGELVLARNQILRHTNGAEDAVFLSTAQRLNLITTELQEGVMKTRMQPIGNVWAKFPRVVRDLSSQLGKQVRIEMEGKETELDKTIVEAIKDPLTHLIRNSVDHGIEKPEVRQAAGKAAEGRLLLRAYHEGGQVNIEIIDDGAGLNLDRIRKKAVERGLIAADVAARMSDREAAQTVLLPGFSTAEQVTSVSGRGVGMDVVKTNIERIGGTIDLQSTPGQGMTIRIKIPLTLAIIPALVVTCGGDRYAIPQVSVLELVGLEQDQARTGIEFVHGAPVFRLRGKLLPLIYLSERLDLNRCGSQVADGIVNIVVLRANDRQFGLVVDGINDTEEIVVKPLSPQLKGLAEYAGATIMGDGAVALILDVMGVAMASGLVEAINEQGMTSLHADESTSSERSETLLIVDLGDVRRYALPVSMISRLENVPRSAIEYADGREVVQYRDAILPLVRLTEMFGATNCPDQSDEEIKIIVFADGGRRYGLVVNRIVDIVETTFQLEPREDDDNLLGTVVIQKHVTDVLNLRQLARSGSRMRMSGTISQ